jgi:hypothetical protein
MSSETDLSRNQAIQNQRNSFLRGFPLPFNVETLQAFGALFQIPQYYRKFLHCKLKMLCKLKKFVTQSRTGLQIYEGHDNQLNRPGPMA